EIVLIASQKIPQTFMRLLIEYRHEGFGVNAVVRRQWAATDQIVNLLEAGETHRLGIATPAQQHGSTQYLRGLATQTGDIQKVFTAGLIVTARTALPDLLLLQVALCAADEVNHAFIADPSVVIEGDDAMMQENDALQMPPISAPSRLMHLFGQDETGHDVGQDHHFIAVKILQNLRSIGAVADGDH